MSQSSDLKNNLHNFGDYFQESATYDARSGRFSNSGQLLHLAASFLLQGWKADGVFKEDNVRWIFDELGWQFHSVLVDREKHTLWVFLLFY